MLFDSISKQTRAKPADAWMLQPPSMYGTRANAGKFITEGVYFVTHAVRCVGRGAAWILARLWLPLYLQIKELKPIHAFWVRGPAFIIHNITEALKMAMQLSQNQFWTEVPAPRLPSSVCTISV